MRQRAEQKGLALEEAKAEKTVFYSSRIVKYNQSAVLTPFVS